MLKFIEAVLMLSGMIIGVGMFAIPFSFARAGFLLGTVELVALSGVVLLTHLLYAEVVLGTGSFHRLPGYIRVYLGRRAGFISWISALLGIVGTLLAYIIVGGAFLGNIFQYIIPGYEAPWVLVLAALGSAITLFPLRKEAFVNGLLTILLVGLAVSLSVLLLSGINIGHLGGISPGNAFVPYGVLLFALSGGVVIPDVITLLGRRRSTARAAITVGSLIPAALYFLFALAVVGTAGQATSQEAISGLRAFVGERIILAGSIAGFLAVITSFIALHGSFEALLRLDLKMPAKGAWLVASVAPLALYLGGFQDFIAIIGAVGALAVGIDAALLIVAYHAMRGREGAPILWRSYAWKIALWLLIAAGAGYEVLSFFKG